MSKGTPVRTFRMGDKQYDKLLKVIQSSGYEGVRAWLEAVADGEVEVGCKTPISISVLHPKPKASLPREEERDASFDWGA